MWRYFSMLLDSSCIQGILLRQARSVIGNICKSTSAFHRCLLGAERRRNVGEGPPGSVTKAWRASCGATGVAEGALPSAALRRGAWAGRRRLGACRTPVREPPHILDQRGSVAQRTRAAE